MITLNRMFRSLLVVSLLSASPIMTHFASAQETLTLESAQNSQPAPENMSPDVARKHFLVCPGGPSTQFRLGGKVTNPTTFNLNKLQAQPYHTTVWAFYRAGTGLKRASGLEYCCTICSRRHRLF